MPNILDLSARLSADVRPFVTSIGNSASASQSTFQSIAQAATTYLGARGLLGTLSRANEAFKSFEQSMADASAISRLSVHEIGDALMSLDNVFGRVSKASQSMYRILSSGFSQLDAGQLVEFQKAVGVSAKVIRADLYNTADVMTTIANAYQYNIDEIKKLQDWFYITVREGKAQGQDLARTLGLVINSASEAGVSLNELGAAIAVLSRTQSASQSMIGLNQMLNAFIKPTLRAQAAAREWGIELSATALKERGLIDVLTELNQKVGGNVEALEAMFGNIRAGRAILSLTGKQFKNYNQVLAMYDGSAGAGMEAFEKQINTVENAYERLQAQEEKTLIQIGDDWSGVSKIFYRTGEALLKAFSDMSPVARWGVYLNGIGLAVKSIIAVVNHLRDSVNGVTNAVDRMTASFAGASATSRGIGGVPPISPTPRNVPPTGSSTPKTSISQIVSSTRYAHNSIMGFPRESDRRNGGFGSDITDRVLKREADSVRQWANTRAFREVREHVVTELNGLRGSLVGFADRGRGSTYTHGKMILSPEVFQEMSKNQVGPQLPHGWKYKSNGLPASQAYMRAPVDLKWFTDPAYTPLARRSGGIFKPMTDMEAMNHVIKNTDTIQHVADNYYNARMSELNKIGVWSRPTTPGTPEDAALAAQHLKEAQQRQARAQFNATRPGQFDTFNQQYKSLNDFGGKTGLSRWWAEKSRGQLTPVKVATETGAYQWQVAVTKPALWIRAANSFGQGVKNSFSKFTDSIGAGLGKAFNAVAVVGMVQSTAEMGWNIGKQIADHFHFADSGLFDYVARTFSGPLINPFISTKSVEWDNKLSQGYSRLDTFNKMYNDAKKAGISENQLAEYQSQVYTDLYTIRTSDNFDTMNNSLMSLDEVINKLAEDIADYREVNQKDREIKEARKTVQTSNENSMAEKRYLQRYTLEQGAMMSTQEKAMFDAYMSNGEAYNKVAEYLTQFTKDYPNLRDMRNLSGSHQDTLNSAANNSELIAMLTELGVDIDAGRFSKQKFIDNIIYLQDFIDSIDAMRKDKNVRKAAEEIKHQQVLDYASKRANKAMSVFNKTSDKIADERKYNDITADFIDNIDALDTKKGLDQASLRKAMNQASTTSDALKELMDAREAIEDAMNDTIAQMRKDRGGKLTQRDIDGIKERFRSSLLTADEQIVNAQRDVLRDKQKLKDKREAIFEDYTDQQVKNLKPLFTANSKNGAGLVEGFSNRMYDILKFGRKWDMKMSDDEIRSAQEKLVEAFDKELTKLLDSDTTLSDIAAKVSGGFISESDMEDAQMEIFKNEINVLNGVLSSLEPVKDNELYSELYNNLTKRRNAARQSYNEIVINSDMRKIGDTLTDALDIIDMDGLRKRISSVVQSRRKITAYRKAVEGYDAELSKISNKESEVYRKIDKSRKDALRNMYQEQSNLQDNISSVRSSFFDSLSNTISGNLEGGRLTNYGMQHAMNLLARLVPTITAGMQGVSLQQVIKNARAGYNGYAPDTSRAMNAQRKLAEVMDSYIASKQYEDAGVARNVHTIVEILGRKQILRLN